MDLNQRAAGVVLHITSLPGPHGVGDFGPDARRFVDWLSRAGQKLWQVLPLNPIGPGDSPYQSVSAFAGGPLMVTLEPLVQQGWLAVPELPAGGFDAQRVDYGRVIPWRMAQLRAASVGFAQQATPAQRAVFEDWRQSQAFWLDDYALFMALETAHGGQPWWLWPEPLRRRDAEALAQARLEHAAEFGFWCFVQWCFDEQARALKAYANAQGVSLMGDVPIFVAHHSADCWARPDLYFLDDDFQPTVVAGVPPDGFGPDGQRWGNPLYRWDRMAEEGFAWWVARVQRALAHADAIRIDHFRGFAGYWEVPASCPTAREGRWAPGPGAPLFAAIESALGPLPIVAEDLGHITPDVIALRDGFRLPGMRIVQEAFGGDAGHPFLPHHHVRHGLAYSSTHDSDTARGWWDSAPAAARAYAALYLQADDETIVDALLQATYRSVANLAMAPLQDLLGLDGKHRMNLPGTASGNWVWRFTWPMVADDVAPRLARWAAATGRAPFELLSA